MTDVAMWTAVPDEPGKGLDEILYPEPTPGERRKAKHEQAERDALAARAQVTADNVAAHSWLARLRGQGMPTTADVLMRARDYDDHGRAEADRLHAARQVLRQDGRGLEDVLDGGRSGVILDANAGVIESSGRGQQLSRSAPVSELDDPRIRRARELLRGADQVIARARSAGQAEIARSAAAPAGHPFCGCLACFEREERRGDVARRQAAADGLVAKGYTPQTAAEAYGLAYR